MKNRPQPMLRRLQDATGSRLGSALPDQQVRCQECQTPGASSDVKWLLFDLTATLTARTFDPSSRRFTLRILITHCLRVRLHVLFSLAAPQCLCIVVSISLSEAHTGYASRGRGGGRGRGGPRGGYNSSNYNSSHTSSMASGMPPTSGFPPAMGGMNPMAGMNMMMPGMSGFMMPGMQSFAPPVTASRGGGMGSGRGRNPFGVSSLNRLVSDALHSADRDGGLRFQQLPQGAFGDGPPTKRGRTDDY